MEKKVGIIGLGSMGSMLLNKIVETNGVDENNIFVSNRSVEKLDKIKTKFPKINVCNNNIDLAKAVDKILVCVEPLNLPNVIHEISSFLTNDSYLMISTTMIAQKDLERLFNGGITIFMPTLISTVNGGVTISNHSEKVKDNDKKFYEELINAFSEVKILNEDDIKMSQNLTAVFPGIFAEIMYEYVNEVEKRTSNVTRKELEDIMLKSLLGVSRLLIETNMGFEETINRVCTKGGITYQGVMALKQSLPQAFDSSVDSVTKRYDEIIAKGSRLIDEIVNR